MKEKPEIYFKNAKDWREWLHTNHIESSGIYLVFYKVDHTNAGNISANVILKVYGVPLIKNTLKCLLLMI